MLYDLFATPGLHWNQRPLSKPLTYSSILPGGTNSLFNMLLPPYPAGEPYQIAIQGDASGSFDYLVTWLFANGVGPIRGSPGIGTPRNGSWATSEIKDFPPGANGLIIAAAGKGPFSITITEAVIGDPASVQAYIQPEVIPEPDILPAPREGLSPAVVIIGIIGVLAAVVIFKRR